MGRTSVADRGLRGRRLKGPAAFWILFLDSPTRFVGETARGKIVPVNGTKVDDMTETAPDSLFQTYRRADLVFVRGEGARLYTPEGDAYLDFASGIAVTALGHAHPHLVAALTEQAQKLWHVSNLYRIPEQERLGARLVANSFADRVFFTNSGAEAVECAIKAARKFHAVHGAPERYRLITFEGAFHGRTLATIAAGGRAQYLEGFGPPTPGFDQVPFADLAAVEAAIGPETAGILLEPVQGEGGVRVFPPRFLRQLRELCDQNGLLLLFDEVQTGMGRTGRLFAHEWSQVTPDIMAVAKGIGGGFPLGACLATEAVAEAMQPGSHGSTFGGNPLAMAVGNAVLDVILAPDFLTEVQAKANRFRQALAQRLDSYGDILEEIRGLGFLTGIKLRGEAPRMVSLLQEARLLAVPAAENVVRLLPPLIVEEAELSEACEKLDRACERFRQPPTETTKA